MFNNHFEYTQTHKHTIWQRTSQQCKHTCPITLFHCLDLAEIALRLELLLIKMWLRSFISVNICKINSSNLYLCFVRKYITLKCNSRLNQRSELVVCPAEEPANLYQSHTDVCAGAALLSLRLAAGALPITQAYFNYCNLTHLHTQIRPEKGPTHKLLRLVTNWHFRQRTELFLNLSQLKCPSQDIILNLLAFLKVVYYTGKQIWLVTILTFLPSLVIFYMFVENVWFSKESVNFGDGHFCSVQMSNGEQEELCGLMQV